MSFFIVDTRLIVSVKLKWITSTCTRVLCSLPFLVDPGLGHVTCFGQWITKECESSRSMITIYTLGLSFVASNFHVLYETYLAHLID